MIISERKISRDLTYYRALSFRSRLDEKDAKKLSVLERGYAGECIYDEVFDDIGHGSVFVFRDIYLGIEDSTAQYDSLIVSDAGIIVNEIKNYSGFYRVEQGKWFAGDFEVPDDPLSQLKRAMNKLLKLKYIHRLNFEIEGKVVFPHIDFRLNCDNRDVREKLVMRSELGDYLKQFKNDYAGRYADRIAEAVSAHIIENPFFNQHADFEAVRKGLYCGNCGSFELENNHFYIKCCKCGSEEKKETHVLRAISDFSALFLSERMTKKRLLEFIDFKINSRTALRMLAKYCNRVENGPQTYYIFKYHDFNEAYIKSSASYRYKDKKVELI